MTALVVHSKKNFMTRTNQTMQPSFTDQAMSRQAAAQRLRAQMNLEDPVTPATAPEMEQQRAGAAAVANTGSALNGLGGLPRPDFAHLLSHPRDDVVVAPWAPKRPGPGSRWRSMEQTSSQ